KNQERCVRADHTEHSRVSKEEVGLLAVASVGRPCRRPEPGWSVYPSRTPETPETHPSAAESFRAREMRGKSHGRRPPPGTFRRGGQRLWTGPRIPRHSGVDCRWYQKGKGRAASPC